MSVLSVRLDPEQDAALDELAKETGRSKSFYVREALASFLEDRSDYLLAIAALEKQEPTISAADLRRKLGL